MRTVTWWTRILVAVVVSITPWVLAVTSVLLFGPAMVSADPSVQDAWWGLEALLLFALTPAVVFWLLRRLIPSVRTLAWAVVGFAVPVIIAVVLVGETLAEHERTKEAVLIVAAFLAPFLAALLGTFVPPGRITLGPQDE